MGVVPVALLLMNDLPPLLVYGLGFATCGAVVILGSALATVEVWINEMREERRR